MFNTSLPSGRRKLFLFLLVVFTIVGFGTKYVLLWLGWVDMTSDEASSWKGYSISVPSPIKPASVIYSEVDQTEAKQVSEAFVRADAIQDEQQKEEKRNELKALTTGDFFQILQTELDQARPVKTVDPLTLTQVTQTDCEQEDVALACRVTTVWNDAQGKKVEQDFLLKLLQENGKWLVEGVSTGGSTD